MIQAAAIGSDGEALVLDMGEPVRIAEVAQRMIAYSGKKIPITYTGLKPGEKLHEILLSEGESDSRPMHPLVSHVSVRPIGPESLASLRNLAQSRPAGLATTMSDLCLVMDRPIAERRRVV